MHGLVLLSLSRILRLLLLVVVMVVLTRMRGRGRVWTVEGRRRWLVWGRIIVGQSLGLEVIVVARGREEAAASWRQGP